jgi:hypothetical protein
MTSTQTGDEGIQSGIVRGRQERKSFRTCAWTGSCGIRAR